MHPLAKLTTPLTPACYAGHKPDRKGPGEETDEDEDGLELPVNPDEGTPLTPDDDGVPVVPR